MRTLGKVITVVIGAGVVGVFMVAELAGAVQSAVRNAVRPLAYVGLSAAQREALDAVRSRFGSGPTSMHDMREACRRHGIKPWRIDLAA